MCQGLPYWASGAPSFLSPCNSYEIRCTSFEDPQQYNYYADYIDCYGLNKRVQVGIGAPNAPRVVNVCSNTFPVAGDNMTGPLPPPVSVTLLGPCSSQGSGVSKFVWVDSNFQAGSVMMWMPEAQIYSCNSDGSDSHLIFQFIENYQPYIGTSLPPPNLASMIDPFPHTHYKISILAQRWEAYSQMRVGYGPVSTPPPTTFWMIFTNTFLERKEIILPKSSLAASGRIWINPYS